MPPAEHEPAAVTVRMTSDASALTGRITLESPYRRGVLELETRGRLGFADETREWLRHSLDELCKPVEKRLDLDWPEAYEVIDRLVALGSTLSSSLVFAPGEGARFRTYLKQCLYAYKANHSRNSIPILQLEAPWECMIPIEFFKLRLHAMNSERRDSTQDLRDSARNILGFHFAVRRLFPRTNPPIIHEKDQLSMRFFWDASLEGAAKELGDLRRLSPKLFVDEPWPGKPEHGEDAFVRMAFGAPPRHPGDTAQSAIRDPEDVWHLACHCSTEAQISLGYFFRFRNRPKDPPIDVSLMALECGFSELEEDGFTWQRPKPFVFMNACGSSRIDPQASSSFPHFWLEQGFAGCVGTEVEVDDVVAAGFSRYFYMAIMEGETLGGAMHRARMTLLERHRNPLGILWTLYADPRQVLVRRT